MAAQGMKIADDKKEQHGDDRPYRAAQGHSAKHVITTSFDTPWHCTKTQTAQDAFLPDTGLSCPQMGSGAHQSTQKKIETCHPEPTFVVFRVQKIEEKTVLNEV